jgi:V-type H+-transporting ATPase subunit C
MSSSNNELWLISAPGESTPQETWDRLQQATQNLSVNSKFNIPDLKVYSSYWKWVIPVPRFHSFSIKVGTLDQLVGLSDDLAKLDAAAEQ